MGLFEDYDEGINSPLDYSSDTDEDSQVFYHPKPGTLQAGFSLWSSEAEPDDVTEAEPDDVTEAKPDEVAEAEPVPDYERQLTIMKDREDNAQLRLMNLERLVDKLGEKKPAAALAPEMVLAVCFSLCVVVMALILVAKFG